MPATQRLFDNLYKEDMVTNVSAAASCVSRSLRQLGCMLCALVLAATSPAALASVYFKYRVVAETGQNSITGLGNGPSVNDAGKVSFVAKFANGDSVFAWDATNGLTDIATNFRSSTRSFGEGVQINDNDEVVTWSRILGATPIAEIRTFRAGAVNDNTVMVRALPDFFPNSYDTLFQFPGINNTKLLEDRSQGGNLDGICAGGEACVSQIAYGAFRAADSPPRHLGTVVKNPQNGADFGQFNEFSLNTSLSRPAISDDGRIAIRGRNSTDPIQLFNYNLGSHKDIATSGDGFTALGLAPGITDDGRIVAFAGNRGEGDGIFLSIELANGNRRLVRIVGENLTVKKSELGVAANGNKLYFSSIDLDSRVGITYTPDYDGNLRGSVVVTFIGTPNAGSRTNPGTNKPFIFSDQKGLWSMRIDLTARLYENACVAPSFGNSASTLPAPTGGETIAQDTFGTHFIKVNPNVGYCQTNNDYRSEALFSRTSPLPVVQIGDTFHNAGRNYTVSAISVNDPVAGATSDAHLQPRSARLGDHRVVFWAQSGADQIIVAAEHLDSDQDGLLDHWETDGMDLEGTGNIDLDLPAMGADPLKRDVFVQMDFNMDRTAPLNIARRHEPAPGVLRQLVQHFASAPALASGVQAGINLHVDAGANLDRAGQLFSRNMGQGPLRGGKTISKNGAPIDILYFGRPNTVTFPGVNTLDFDTAKVANFWNTQRGAREFAFLYIIFADFHHGLGSNGGSNNVSPVTGTATGSTANRLIDTNNPTIANGFGGHAVKITGGTGAGQLRTIAGSGLDINTHVPVIIVDDPWTVLPDSTSTYILLHGSGGEGNAGSRTDGAFLPGRSLAITLGGYNTYTPDVFQGNFRDEWQTVAHEVGHLLTLMHGGTNHGNNKPDFLSLMNYAYSNCPPGQNGKGPGGSVLAGAAPCPIDRYSLHNDKVFPDWEHLDLKGSLNFGRLTQAFGPEPDENPPNPPEPETRTSKEITDRFGPLDYVAPTVGVNVPAAGASTSQGSGIAVSFTATDDVAIARAEVHFDVNGDGVIDEATEVISATAGAGNSFTANIPAIGGANGARMLTVFAYDTSGNPGYASRTINVGAAVPVSVPNIVGQTQAAASAAITGAGLTVGTITQQASSSVPAGSVISQAPAAGASVSNGSAVNLVISTGAAATNVPNVVGQTQAAASIALTGAGLTVGTITQQASQSVPAGSVISQNPAAGASVSSGAAVNLVISTGPAAISVPNLVGQTQAAASIAITGAGLTVGTITQQASQSVPAGSVISQAPAAGASVSSGSAVNLVVSTGAASISVPNVVAQTQAAATTAITGAGLTLGTITQQASSSVPAGSIISQNPAAGAAVAAGSSVSLVISSGPVVTNVSGATATGSGVASASLSGGGVQCGFGQSAFLPLAGAPGSPPQGSAPTGVSFPHGLFGFTATSCTAGGMITVTITYPQPLPAGAQYWKYGPTPGNAPPHWYVMPATVNGNIVTFTIVDGGLGDDDLVANGTIVDQGGPGVAALIAGAGQVVAQIPTLHESMLALLSVLLAAIGCLRYRNAAHRSNGHLGDRRSG